MKDFQAQALHSLTHNINSFAVKEVVDLAVVSRKRVALLVSKNQYLDLLGSFGLFLNHKNLLLVGSVDLKESSPPGFRSTYDRLMEKLSLNLFLGLDDIDVFVCIKNIKELTYKKTIQSIKVDSSVSFKGLVDSLEKTGYNRVENVFEAKQFCVKGGIIDFYSPVYQFPIRVYFYDDTPSFVFYDLSTGLPKREKIKGIYLSKSSDETVVVLTETLLKKYNFMVIDLVDKEQKKNKQSIQPISEKNFKKDSQNIIYNNKIHFAAYQINNTIFAPTMYQHINEQPKEPLGFVSGFNNGDFVCHEDYGIGVFMGLYKGASEDDEFIKIQYLDGTINLSVKRFFKLSFVSRETNTTQLVSSLNKKGVWKRKGLAIQKSVEKYVDNLVNIYAKKNTNIRPSFVFGGELETSFLEAFNYTDTTDQVLVWDELKGDLEGDFPMSRLLCGDVGFGKTEMAIRAAFRVVINGGRVVVLCPTSILVNQHLAVFKERLTSFGVTVSGLVGGLLKTKKTEIKVAWVDKKIDILIATSAALYDDVFIKFASFFVVDEEHRFGVKQKEVLVNKFVNKDVLFMSATPIPRTLHLSLAGIHNISTLASPPVLRKPISTVVSYFSEKLIKQGVDFELSRGGQVFYLHNRVENILSIKSFLLRLCPSVSVGVVHSSLGLKKISVVVEGFINKKYNLLLCSSVIASGIDIPNANTIFVDNSHLFGLAQLHQIRGRVGRGGSQAFAYLLVPKNKTLTVSGKKRLKTIEQNSTLGSGYNLSKADLEIRGGGVVFGYKQSGSIYDVGYEYYSKILSRCFEEKTNKTNISDVDSFNYQVSFVCLFRESYISLGYERLQVYRELSSLYFVDDVSLFEKKLTQIYGPFSLSEKNVLSMRVVSILCGNLNINNLKYKNSVLELFFNNSFNRVNYLIKFLGLYKEKFSVLSFKFGVVGDATNLKITFVRSGLVDGLFLKRFIGGFDVFCEK
tara:strand:- start:6103 stop:8997 length:2895 start_codon:yes stop_codon:yes gene_type:complete